MRWLLPYFYLVKNKNCFLTLIVSLPCSYISLKLTSPLQCTEIVSEWLFQICEGLLICIGKVHSASLKIEELSCLFCINHLITFRAEVLQNAFDIFPIFWFGTWVYIHIALCFYLDLLYWYSLRYFTFSIFFIASYYIKLFSFVLGFTRKGNCSWKSSW